MDFTKATDEQILVLIDHETNIPKETMKEIALEAINRDLFKGVIFRTMKMTFKHIPKNHDDLKQLGYIGVTYTMEKYNETFRSPFNALAHKNIHEEFYQYIRKENTLGRKSERNKWYLDQEVKHDSDETFTSLLIDERQNVEKQVIDKIYLEDSFKKLNNKEKKLLYYFALGYSMNEMEEMVNLSVASVSRNMNTAFLKINPIRPRVNLKQLGLTKKALTNYPRKLVKE